MFNNIDTAKSYTTEANLVKALDALGWAADDYMVVRNREGRFTAIFSHGMVKSVAPAHQGFKLFG